MTAAAVFVAAVVGAAVPAVPAQAITFFSGGCTMELQVESSEVISLSPELLTLDLSGGGTCVVNGTVAAMSFVGSVATHPTFGGFGCAGGVAAGQALFAVAVPGFPGMTLEVTVTSAGGTVVLVATNALLRYDGVALLTQDAADTEACVTAGITDTTWTGALAFQDPDPMPV